MPEPNSRADDIGVSYADMCSDVVSRRVVAKTW
jgi:hypothetical protein